MKKGIVSFIFMAAFAAYAVFQNIGGTSAVADTSTVSPISTVPAVPVAAPVTTTGGGWFGDDDTHTVAAPTPTPAPATPAPAPAATPVATTVAAPVSKPKGQYTDGTYTGPVANAYYGNIQVQAVVSGGKLTNVLFLQYPSDRSTSRMINGQAMPYLKQEAIAAQSAQVNIISGATDSSIAFQQSLGSALAQAKI